MHDRDVSLMMYQVKANHIESLKSSLWRNAYYTILAQSGIVGLLKIFESNKITKDWPPVIAAVLFLPSIISCLASLGYTRNTIKDLIDERRDTKTILEELSPCIQQRFAKGQMDKGYAKIRYELPYALMYIVPVFLPQSLCAYI